MRQTERQLQPAGTATRSRRWTIRRKAALLEAVRSGMLSLETASQRYALSLEELRTWERDFERYGVYGLRATRLQIYRAPVRGNPSLKKKAGRPVKKLVAGMGAIESGRLKQLEEENAKLKRLLADVG